MYLEPFNFVNLCESELFEKELFDHLTVCKEMSVYLNCQCWKHLCAKKWFIVNRIICIS